jgi:calcineurin-like phosphoesterase family protein
VSQQIFFTSDWHLGHDNVIRFDKRPFQDIHHMYEVLVNNYNSTVSEDGICYFLGDIGFGAKEPMIKILSRLNSSQKIFIKGNHDKSNGFLYDLGFDLVQNAAMLNLGKHLITLSHCPLRGVFRESRIKPDGSEMKGMAEDEMWHGENRHKAFSLPDFGQFHLHGHTHKQGAEVKVGRQWDIGAPGNNYRPVSMSAVESWIAQMTKGPNEKV